MRNWLLFLNSTTASRVICVIVNQRFGLGRTIRLSALTIAGLTIRLSPIPLSSDRLAMFIDRSEQKFQLVNELGVLDLAGVAASPSDQELSRFLVYQLVLARDEVIWDPGAEYERSVPVDLRTELGRNDGEAAGEILVLELIRRELAWGQWIKPPSSKLVNPRAIPFKR